MARSCLTETNLLDGVYMVSLTQHFLSKTVCVFHGFNTDQGLFFKCAGVAFCYVFVVQVAPRWNVHASIKLDM